MRERWGGRKRMGHLTAGVLALEVVGIAATLVHVVLAVSESLGSSFAWLPVLEHIRISTT